MFISFCTIGGEETKGVVTIETTTETKVVEEEITFEEGVLEFAQCMREEGIDFPDPTFDIDGNPEFNELNIENEEAFEEAFTNCEDILRKALPEQFDLDPEVEAALIDASLEFSQCMREQGIDFPDPTPGEFGFFAFRDADVDWSSEQLQEASRILHFFLRSLLFHLSAFHLFSLILQSLPFSKSVSPQRLYHQPLLLFHEQYQRMVKEFPLWPYHFPQK